MFGTQMTVSPTRLCCTISQVEHDPARLGNRGSHRYSFGNSCAFFGAQVRTSLGRVTEPGGCTALRSHSQ